MLFCFLTYLSVKRKPVSVTVKSKQGFMVPYLRSKSLYHICLDVRWVRHDHIELSFYTAKKIALIKCNCCPKPVGVFPCDSKRLC